MNQWITDIRNGDRALYITGLVHLVLAVIFIIMSGFDSRMIHLENIWLKPFRFSVSIFLFTWTYAWFSNFYDRKKTVSWLNLIIAICMFIEIFLITMQAVRGVHSHFNFSTNFDAVVYAIMGGVIGLNGIILGILFIIFVFFERGGGEYRSAIVWGMFLFLFGNLAGYLMTLFPAEMLALKQFAGRFPVLGWAQELSDLRIAHFLGLHAIQVMPVVHRFYKKLNFPSGSIHFSGIIYLVVLVIVMFSAIVKLTG